MRRFGRLILTVLIISTIVFLVIRVIPGDPALTIAGVDASESDITAIRVTLGTDKPILNQYLQWIWSVFRFDFGHSMTSGRPVSQLILERFPLTLTLAVLGIVLSIFIAIPLGVISAVRRWSFWDYLGMLFSQVGMAIP
ncbi:MAG: ABC transporter permease, partial [Gammaproteobacteria bacterium]|nr:ABC transporter permease [Gammaproteobacteria bacterium]